MPKALTITDKTGRPLSAADAQSLGETGVRILERSREGARAPRAKKELPTLSPILLEGEASHGKTAIAQAVAADVGAKTTVLSAHEVESPAVRAVTAGGDTVVVLFDGAATARDGRPYRNTYSWHSRYARVTAPRASPRWSRSSRTGSPRLRSRLAAS